MDFGRGDIVRKNVKQNKEKQNMALVVAEMAGKKVKSTDVKEVEMNMTGCSDTESTVHWARKQVRQKTVRVYTEGRWMDAWIVSANRYLGQ